MFAAHSVDVLRAICERSWSTLQVVRFHPRVLLSYGSNMKLCCKVFSAVRIWNLIQYLTSVGSNIGRLTCLSSPRLNCTLTSRFLPLKCQEKIGCKRRWEMEGMEYCLWQSPTNGLRELQFKYSCNTHTYHICGHRNEAECSNNNSDVLFMGHQCVNTQGRHNYSSFIKC